MSEEEILAAIAARPKGPGIWLEWHCQRCLESGGGVTDATEDSAQGHANETGHDVRFTEMKTRILTPRVPEAEG